MKINREIHRAKLKEAAIGFVHAIIMLIGSIFGFLGSLSIFLSNLISTFIFFIAAILMFVSAHLFFKGCKKRNWLPADFEYKHLIFYPIIRYDYKKMNRG